MAPAKKSTGDPAHFARPTVVVPVAAEPRIFPLLNIRVSSF
jgi:hypothetical protein